MGTRDRRRVDRSEAEWRQILERFETSGQTQLAFCRSAGISPTTFHVWRRRLRADRTLPTPFIDVTPVTRSRTSSGWVLEVEFRDGTTARVRAER